MHPVPFKWGGGGMGAFLFDEAVFTPECRVFPGILVV